LASVQLQVQLQHVDPRLAEEPELAPLSEIVYQRSELRRIESAHPRDPQRLVQRAISQAGHR